MLDIFSKPELIVEQWVSPLFEQKKIHVSVLRSDLVHPWIQGNKWYKLQIYLHRLKNENRKGFFSIGGPYSNHLIALSFAGNQLACHSTFFIRGGREEWKGNPAINQMLEWGSELIPLSRSDFRSFDPTNARTENPFLEDFVWVPMGGSESSMIPFLKSWVDQIVEQIEFDVVVLPVATAGTLSGFAAWLPSHKKIMAIEVLKSNGFLEDNLVTWLQAEKLAVSSKPIFISDYHFGGYANTNSVLKDFCKRVFKSNKFPIESIYSGKAFYAVSGLAEKGYFQEGSRILLLHTGGVFPWNMSR